MRPRQLLVLASTAAVTVVLAIGITVWQDSVLLRDHEPETVFPGLIDRLNDVQDVVVESPNETFTIRRDGEGGWSLPGLAGYPVEPERVKQVLVSMAVLETLEPKTGNPERHGALGLNDPTAPEGGATSISLQTSDGTSLAVLLVGQDARGNADTRYIRRSGEEQTWLAWRNFDLPGRATGWLEPSIVALPRWRVKRIVIEQGDGSSVEVGRDVYSDQMFLVRNIPEGYEPVNPFVANQLGVALERISMVTAKRRDEVPFPPDVPVARVETFDGMRLTVRTAEVDNVDWMQIEAAYDPSVREELPEGGPNIVGLPEMPTLEEVEAEVEELNARYVHWVFAVPPAKRVQLSRTLGDLIQEIPEEEPGEEPGPPEG